MLTIIIGTVLFFILLFISMIHIYWGIGGKWAASAAVPTNEKNEKIMKIF